MINPLKISLYIKYYITMAHLESLRQTNKICNMQIQYFFCMHCWEEFRRKQYEEIIISKKKNKKNRKEICVIMLHHSNLQNALQKEH